MMTSKIDILGHFQGQNTNSGPLNPFNGIFGANLVSYPQGNIANDLKELFWSIKHVVSRRGDVMMTSKN